MRKLPLFFIIICHCVFSQDTIRFRSGESLAAKVNEVGITDINYNRFDNLQGPKYVVNQNDVLFIKYAGGHVDSFKVTKPKIKTAELKPAVSYDSRDKISLRGNILIYKGKGLGESRLLKLVNAYPDNAKKNVMMKTYTEMKQYKKKQYLFGFGMGLGVGIGAPYIGALAAAFSNDVTPLLVGVILGTSVGVTGVVLSSVNKKNRINKKLEIARLYNE